MPAPQRQVLETVRSQCERSEERFTGYRKELLDTLAEVLHIERVHKTSATNVVQQIEGKCEALADLLLRRQR